MPNTPVSTITRAATRKPGEPLNILTCPTHERYESNLAATGHNFYAFQSDQVKGWNTNYAALPDNYTLLDGGLGNRQIPLDLDLDLVLSQNKFGQFQILSQVAHSLNLPMVSLEHTLPVPSWDEKTRETMVQSRGDINVFISDYSIDEWKFERTPDVKVIKHCVDSQVFVDIQVQRENQILSVVNDWINRDWCCGFQIYQLSLLVIPPAYLNQPERCLN